MIAFSHLHSLRVIFVLTKAFAKAFVLPKLNSARKIYEGYMMIEVLRVTALVTDWALEGQSLGLWQKHCYCKGPMTIVCCCGRWRIVFMSSRFNNDVQSRYSPIEGKL